MKCKGHADAFCEELEFCCQQVVEQLVADKQLWTTVNDCRCLVSSFSCVDGFEFHQASECFVLFCFVDAILHDSLTLSSCGIAGVSEDTED